MKKMLYLLPVVCFVIACSSHTGEKKIIIGPAAAWLDSVKKQSDTSYTNPYRNEDFATAEYYVNRSKHTVCQVMKDKKGTIRQILAANNEDVRLFFAAYYTNGQLMADLPLDELGKFNGHAVYYYENGSLRSEGNYAHGLLTGEWKNYGKNGKVSSTDHYDENGGLIINH